MRKTKKGIALLLSLLITASSLWAFSAAALAYSGSDFTDNAALAQKMSDIITGNAKIFNNSTESYGVGDSFYVGQRYTWGPYNLWGYSCLAYAQAVYYYLFGELCANPSERLLKSFVALEKKPLLTYEDLKNAGVGFGAYVRTTGNSDLSFNAGNGHSFIILSYNPETITFLEGNADYSGLIAIQDMTWDAFNQRRLTNAGRGLCFIIQPNETKGQLKERAVEEPKTLAAAQTEPAEDAPSSAKVDYNCNGRVDAEDARMALRVSVDLEPASDDFAVLDVSGDGAVNAEDARILLRMAVGLE